MLGQLMFQRVLTQYQILQSLKMKGGGVTYTGGDALMVFYNTLKGHAYEVPYVCPIVKMLPWLYYLCAYLYVFFWSKEYEWAPHCMVMHACDYDNNNCHRPRLHWIDVDQKIFALNIYRIKKYFSAKKFKFCQVCTCPCKYTVWEAGQPMPRPLYVRTQMTWLLHHMIQPSWEQWRSQDA